MSKMTAGRYRFVRFCLFFCAGAFSAWAQSAQITGGSVYIGYTPPTRQTAAPGQVVPLFVRGLSTTGTLVNSDLPVSQQFAGIRVSAVSAPAGTFSGDLPIFGVTPAACGPTSSAPCGMNAVLVQLPTEVRSCGTTASPLFADSCDQTLTLTVLQDGNALAQLEVRLVTSIVQVLDRCNLYLRPLSGGTPPAEVCGPFAHGDGRPVTSDQPIHPGETLMVSAVGLGYGLAAIPRGTPPPADAPALPNTIVKGLLAPISASSQNSFLDISALPPADAVGLVPGQVGTYFINFKVPDTLPADTETCTTGLGVNAQLFLSVSSGSASVLLFCIEP